MHIYIYISSSCHCRFHGISALPSLQIGAQWDCSSVQLQHAEANPRCGLGTVRQCAEMCCCCFRRATSERTFELRLAIFGYVWIENQYMFLTLTLFCSQCWLAESDPVTYKWFSHQNLHLWSFAGDFPLLRLITGEYILHQYTSRNGVQNCVHEILLRR